MLDDLRLDEAIRCHVLPPHRPIRWPRNRDQWPRRADHASLRRRTSTGRLASPTFECVPSWITDGQLARASARSTMRKSVKDAAAITFAHDSFHLTSTTGAPQGEPVRLRESILRPRSNVFVRGRPNPPRFGSDRRGYVIPYARLGWGFSKFVAAGCDASRLVLPSSRALPARGARLRCGREALVRRRDPLPAMTEWVR